jgi:hypothetical protein
MTPRQRHSTVVRTTMTYHFSSPGARFAWGMAWVCDSWLSEARRCCKSCGCIAC